MNYIWTTHASKRLTERKLARQQIEATISHPDVVTKRQGGLEYRRKNGVQTYFAIVKEDNREKVIISCWVNPPNSGTKDAKRQQRYVAMQKASFAKKLWIVVLNQLGI